MLFVLYAPEDEEGDGNGDHQNNRDNQRGNAAFADDDILKLRHFSSSPHTSTQKPLWPQEVQVSLRVVGV